MKPTSFLCLFFISATMAAVPDWQSLPECLRSAGQILNDKLNLYDDRCSQSQVVASLPEYFSKLDEAERNLRLIKQLLDQPSS